MAVKYIRREIRSLSDNDREVNASSSLPHELCCAHYAYNLL
jgi:hypothetical protein